MTIKDIPIELYTDVRRRWYGDAYLEALVHLTSLPTPNNRAADREGLTNPDENTTRFEWDTDLTAQEEAAWDAIVDRITVGRGSATGPSEAAVDAMISQMKTFQNRTGTPTAAQIATTMDALMNYLRYLQWQVRQK